MHNLNSAVRQFEAIASLVSQTNHSKTLPPLERFQAICDRERIKVINDQSLSFRGAYTRYRERDFIILDPRMEQIEREFVAFHELGHYFHRHTDDGPLSEFEANFFAFLSLQPGGER